MAQIRMTRDFFLWCMSIIYLFAFASLFVQIPGLYGDNGLLPARLVLQKEPANWEEFFTQPTLIRLMPKLGLDAVTSMDCICLGGILLAFAAMISRTQRNAFVFALLWLLYFSLFQVGQTFLWFQWDILLLEAGFLCILAAPFRLWHVTYSQGDTVSMWLVRWLLFRLMFASGVVKLTSKCPTWWDLTALTYHYETQCIPPPTAWLFHQLPAWFHKLSVVAVYIIEIAVPFLYFSPVKTQRLFAFYCQVLLMGLIMVTGNYNFFNLLTLALSLSLIDDDCIEGWLSKTVNEKKAKNVLAGKFHRPIKLAFNLVVFGGLLYATVKLFSINITFQPFAIESKIVFTSLDLQNFLLLALPISIWMGGLSLLVTVIVALYRSLTWERGFWKRVSALLGCSVLAVAAAFMFCISLVEHAVVEPQFALWKPLYKWHALTKNFEVVNSYGLFRRMTGVGGRPEVIIEGSMSLSGPWKEYDFMYKPGNLSGRLPHVAPHQPRLDWQMWFAALGSYNQNPWFVNMIYRLFNNQKEVLDLMGSNPFKDNRPVYLRALLYHYHFTKWSDLSFSNNNWWTRKFVREYFPIISSNDTSFIQYLKTSNIYQIKGEPSGSGPLYYALYNLRKIVGQPDGMYTCITLFTPGLILTFLDPTLKLLQDNWFFK